jgi:hypothetical protein
VEVFILFEYGEVGRSSSKKEAELFEEVLDGCVGLLVDYYFLEFFGALDIRR